MAERRSNEDLDRELIDLLNELRVALPGVQVLFALLLAVPFANAWDRVGPTFSATSSSSRSCAPRQRPCF